MNQFKGYLICTDCDGTLTDSEGKVSEKNAEAIRYFQREGGLFTLATGRFPEHINQFQNQLMINAPIVSLNGTALFDTKANKLINNWTMKKQDCMDMFEYLQKNWDQVWEYWLNYTCHDSVGYKPGEHHPGDGSLQKMFAPLPEELYKIVIIQHEDVTPLVQKDLKEKYGDKFRFDTSWQNGLEIQDINSGKGIAVKYMKDYMNADIHTTIGIGDYENDITLLEYADIGYAVANALDSVKKVADRVTVSNNESAIAEVIYDIEKRLNK